MYNLDACYVVHLYYLHPSIHIINTKYQQLPQRMYQVKKYHSNLNNQTVLSVNNVMLKEYSFPPLLSNYEVVNDNLEFFLHNFISQNNKLVQLEFRNYDDSKKFEHFSCSVIIATNMMTGEQCFVSPHRYGEDSNQFIMDNSNTLKIVTQDNTVTTQKFLQKFNDTNISNKFRLITPENVVEEIVNFCHKNKMVEKGNVVDLLQIMLQSSEYKLSDEFKSRKLNLNQVQFQVDKYTFTKQISKNDILHDVFNINNSVSLI